MQINYAHNYSEMYTRQLLCKSNNDCFRIFTEHTIIQLYFSPYINIDETIP